MEASENKFFKILGYTTALFSCVVLIIVMKRLISGEDFIGGFAFYVLSLILAAIFTYIGDKDGGSYLATLYGIGLTFLSILMLSITLIQLILLEDYFIDGSEYRPSFQYGRYLGVNFMIIFFAFIGMIGFLDFNTGKLNYPSIIPYTLVSIGLLCVFLFGYIYLFNEKEPTDFIAAEIFPVLVTGGMFYFSFKNSNILD